MTTTRPPIAAFIWVAIVIGAIVFLLSGCVTDENGNTRLDVDATKAVIGTGFDAYDRYRRYDQPTVVTPTYGDTLYHQGQVIPAPNR